MPVASADTSSVLTVNPPTCVQRYSVPLTQVDRPIVQVNITSSVPIQDLQNLNVTFHYRPVNGSQQAAAQYFSNETLDKKLPMSIASPYTDNDGTYRFVTVAKLPVFQSGTVVYGNVTETYTQGHANYSVGSVRPAYTCSYYSTGLNTTLSLDFYVLNVTPKYLSLTGNFSGSV